MIDILAAPAAHAEFLHQLGGVPTIDRSPVTVDGRVIALGRLGSLPVWTVPDSSNNFATCARQLARAGRVGLLLGQHSSRPTQLAAVTVAPIRIVQLPSDGMEGPVHRRLRQAAATASHSPLATAIALAEALDLDAAGRRTFRLLNDLIERGVEQLPNRVPREERHGWLLTQCTRLLFLRFVEAEGWLNHDERFLLKHFDRCLHAKRDPLKHYLQPLFFGTLNRPATDRLRVAREFGAVPFLNGGLFQPHALEMRHQFSPPTSWWREAFESLAERIEVTLEPEAPSGEVTPEMLGRVFEGVMALDERKGSGAYYTPSPLVRALVRTALVPHLAAQLGVTESEIDRRLDDPDLVMQRALLQLRILDPAVGSGAFLVGTLDLLHGPGDRHPGRVRHLVTRSLYGIDRHPGAVRITELRLWLEVLRPMRGAMPGQIPPLPNLDAAVRAGDALIDPLFGAPLSGRHAQMGQQQRALAGAHGAVKQRLLAELRRAERDAMLASLSTRAEGLARQIRDLMEQGRTETLFGEPAGLQANDKRELAALRKQWVEARRAVRTLLRDTTATPFAPAVAFAPVLSDRGGFDLVVGNPPWVRAERLPVQTRSALRERYQWWRGTASRGYQHQPDLSVAFVERGLEMLRPGGSLAMLLPAKLATTQYASTMREGLVRRTTLRCVADLAADSRAVFEATTYPMAMIASKATPPVGHRIRLGLSGECATVQQSRWTAGTAWTLRAPEVRQLAERLCQEFPRLGESLTPQLGVKTGANDLFLNPPEHLGGWTRPALRGRDLGGQRSRTTDSLLWPADADGTPWKTLPAEVAAYLQPHRARLERRSDLHDHQWWRLFRTTAATAAHRVVWSDLAKELVARPLPDRRVVPLNSCYLVALPSSAMARALGAWLNSSWLRQLAWLHADPAAQGYARFNARVVAGLPLPEGVLNNVVLQEVGTLSQAGNQSDRDTLVADLLGLTSDDRHILASLATHRR